MTRVAVVTGAADGIGLAICERLKNDGWRVVGIDLGFGHESPDSRVADVSDRGALQNALADLDQIDAVVSNAAVMIRASLVSTTVEDWQRTIDTNLGASFHLLGLTHDRLASSQGSFVAVASVHALATSDGAAAYATSKAGLLGLVRAAALEFAEDGIRVNAVAPGATKTGMLDQSGAGFESLVERTPLKRAAEPKEIADTVAFLVGDESTFITGQSIVVDGGVLSRLSSE